MKKWYKSKTIWLGVAAVLASVCGTVASGADWRTVALAAVGAIGVWLRTQTGEPVGK